LIQPVVAPVDLVQVRRGDIRPQKVAEGIVVPYSRGLSFLASDAPISAIHVKHGQTVSEGELLAELDMSVWLSRLEGAQSELGHLMRVADYEDAIADIRLELMQMDAKEAAGRDGSQVAALNLGEYEKRDDIRRETHELDRARLQSRIGALAARKGNYKISAPFDGVIISIESLMIGNYPSGRAPFLYIADLNRLTVRSLTEQTSFFASAQSIIAVTGDDEWPIAIIPYTLEEQLAFYYEGITPPARFGFMTEGDSFAAGQAPPTDKRVLIKILEMSSEDVIIIPINAAHTETASDDEGVTSRQEFAYVDVNGVRERRDIRCGRRSDILLEVIDGLEEGEYVYVAE
jgi:macrolide-specific efflux system membrane fusion protein